MGKTHLVIPDPHARPGNDNKRAEWIGCLVNDTKPDTVVVLGDTADLPSLCSYDRGKRSFHGRTYAADMAAHSDFQDRLWSTVKRAKKRLPNRITLIGNHEQRIERAIDVQPELDGVISYKDLELDSFYDQVVHYSGGTPGTIEINGVLYGHYLVSGVAGRAIYGEHTGYSLLGKQHTSCVVGHNHTLDYCLRTKPNGQKIIGLSAGCCFDYFNEFAGEANKLYWRGVILLKDVVDGQFDLETITLAKLKKVYG